MSSTTKSSKSPKTRRRQSQKAAKLRQSRQDRDSDESSSSSSDEGSSDENERTTPTKLNLGKGIPRFSLSMTGVRRDKVPNDQGTDQSAEPLNYETDRTPQDFVDRFLNDSDSALPKLSEDQLTSVTALDDRQESVVYQQMVEMLSRTGEPSDEQKMFHPRSHQPRE